MKLPLPLKPRLTRLAQMLLAAFALFFCATNVNGPIDSDEARVIELCARPGAFSAMNPFAQALAIPIVDLHGITQNLLTCTSVSVLGPSIFASRLPALLITLGFLVYLLWISRSLPTGLSLLVFGMVAANGELLWYGASSRGYLLAVFLSLVVLDRYQSTRAKGTTGFFLLCLALCFSNSVASLFFLLFGFGFLAAGLWNHTPLRISGKVWLPAVPIALVMVAHMYLQHREFNVRTEPRVISSYLSIIGGLFGMPRALWGAAILGFAGLAFYRRLPDLKRWNQEPFLFVGAFAFLLIFAMTIGLNRPTPVRIFLPLAIPILFFLYSGVSRVPLAPLRHGLGLALVGLFAVVPHFYRAEMFDQRHMVLPAATGALIEEARALQNEKPAACFAFAGDRFEASWMKHFATRRGTPELRTCSGEPNYVLYWGEADKVSGADKLSIVRANDRGLLLKRKEF